MLFFLLSVLQYSESYYHLVLFERGMKYGIFQKVTNTYFELKVFIFVDDPRHEVQDNTLLSNKWYLS